MKTESEFKRELKRLLFDRAYPIFRELNIKGTGKKYRWTHEYRERRITELWEIAQKLLLERARRQLDDLTFGRKLKNIRGPKKDRPKMLYDWAKTNFPNGPILYAFWKKDKCVYVGSGESHGRILGYKKSKYLDRAEADSLEVWSVRGQSNCHCVECLAYHLYQPKDNENKPQRKRYAKACPICQKKKIVHSGLHALLD